MGPFDVVLTNKVMITKGTKTNIKEINKSKRSRHLLHPGYIKRLKYIFIILISKKLR
jgi:hypothetical protein